MQMKSNWIGRQNNNDLKLTKILFFSPPAPPHFHEHEMRLLIENDIRNEKVQSIGID